MVGFVPSCRNSQLDVIHPMSGAVLVVISPWMFSVGNPWPPFFSSVVVRWSGRLPGTSGGVGSGYPRQVLQEKVGRVREGQGRAALETLEALVRIEWICAGKKRWRPGGRETGHWLLGTGTGRVPAANESLGHGGESGYERVFRPQHAIWLRRKTPAASVVGLRMGMRVGWVNDVRAQCRMLQGGKQGRRRKEDRVCDKAMGAGRWSSTTLEACAAPPNLLWFGAAQGPRAWSWLSCL